MDFDVIPYDDIKGNWKKLGAGSFGNVYKGTYLGIDVAIKEVLPSTEYDVAKYFEREWRLMKEARHPNVVLYLGLSRAPPPDGRIFIISEFVENGNLRIYIHDKTKPFPWRLRISFATDIARALAYLHARKCIHRDLKGENLLVTANGRLKVTDFGFARIAARNEEEVKRLTFCGTDSYMSPEILLGNEFDLPTDIFSLGVIFCEILSRRLADDSHFKRTLPGFGIDPAEVRKLASPGCPPELIDLAIDCCAEDPAHRPTTLQILERLRAIELDILSRPSEADDQHVGSIKFLTGKRPSLAPRIPSFGMGVGQGIRSSSSSDSTLEESDEDDELMEAVLALENVKLGGEHISKSDWSNHTAETNTTAAAAHGHGNRHQPLQSDSDGGPLLSNHPSQFTDYSTTVIKSGANPHVPPSLSSLLTIKADTSPDVPTPSAGADSTLSIETYHTARSSSILSPSIAAATEGSTMTARPSPSTLLHRFTLIKPGAAKRNSGSNVPEQPGGWSPFDFFFSSGLLVAKCDLCTKRLGWKPVLECDDCGLRAHIKCGEIAPRDCGLRTTNRRATHGVALQSVSPLSKVKQNAKGAAAVVNGPSK